jgi:flagellar basal-body rod modification protein FlgD
VTSINSIQPNSSIFVTSNQQNKDLGKDAFLKILVTQLQNQDATQPMKDGEFISQMSQLSVMEQLSNLNKSLTMFLYSQMDSQLTEYSSMIDKKVTWTNPETSIQESGIVSGVLYKDDLVYFKIGEKEILANTIQSIESIKQGGN